MKPKLPLWYKLDANGIPIPASRNFVEWMYSTDEGLTYRRIGFVQFGKIRISTVFLTTDHSFGFGNPLWFETMVFEGNLNEECERYCLIGEAREGHEIMVNRVLASFGFFKRAYYRIRRWWNDRKSPDNDT